MGVNVQGNVFRGQVMRRGKGQLRQQFGSFGADNDGADQFMAVLRADQFDEAFILRKPKALPLAMNPALPMT